MRLTTDKMGFQYLVGPDAELGTSDRMDAVSQGNDHIQVVMILLPGYLAFALILNCSEFPNSCCRL